MKKYICNACKRPCEITVSTNSCAPKCCPYNMIWKAVNWNKAAENLQDKPLPKLTTEVFDRLDCPKWAQYAAVDSNGAGYYYSEKPFILSKEFGWCMTCSESNRSEIISGDFNNRNWHISLIKRPEKNTLPEWVEVGGYVFDPARGYGKIISGSVNACHIQFECMEASFLPEDFADFKQARLRPYNADEIPKLPFEVSEINSDFRTIVTSCKGDKIWLGGASTAISTEELMRDFHYEGFPCGVFEHLENGEWVE